jgi:hypothetical protein
MQKEFRGHLGEVPIEGKLLEGMKTPVWTWQGNGRLVHMKSCFSTRIEILGASVVLTICAMCLNDKTSQIQTVSADEGFKGKINLCG